jgi:hypothetical protein
MTPNTARPAASGSQMLSSMSAPVSPGVRVSIPRSGFENRDNSLAIPPR